MAEFIEAHKLTSLSEKGYSNNPNDAGEETWNGISRRYHPNAPIWELIDKQPDPYNMSESVKADLNQMEIRFYKVKFWNRIKGDKIKNQNIANFLYDIAVNSGYVRAIKFLQRSLNLMNRRQKDYKDLEVDGKIGTKTLATLNIFLTKRSEFAMCLALGHYMINHWVARAERDETQEVFINGIFNRWLFNAKNITDNLYR